MLIQHLNYLLDISLVYEKVTPICNYYKRVSFGELIHIDGEDALKTDTAGFGLIGHSSPK